MTFKMKCIINRKLRVKIALTFTSSDWVIKIAYEVICVHFAILICYETRENWTV